MFKCGGGVVVCRSRWEMFKCGGGRQEEVLKLERVRVRRKRRGMEGLFPMFCLFCFCFFLKWLPKERRLKIWRSAAHIKMHGEIQTIWLNFLCYI